VKRFVTPQFSFDDLLSEGIRTLIVAVEKFDFGRGFRFSTYAYRAISRNAYRAVHDRQQEIQRFAPASEALPHVAEESGNSISDERAWVALRDRLTRFVGELDRRERFIIRSRYALGSHRRTRTFQDLAELLGLSKERVRQLEQRAVTKLQRMAAESSADEPVDAVAWT
ncbi:MAG: sigma-70 family RNA polymerase sigma factor, partial [Planctomycetales bacterium]|nr:sigma-70 family RNA polymerase sigma factor [Planctomycetales bacterium]